MNFFGYLVIATALSQVGVGVVQYLEYLPEPSVGANECNSTEHYNGLLQSGNFICVGGREARTECKVMLLSLLLLRLLRWL